MNRRRQSALLFAIVAALILAVCCFALSTEIDETSASPIGGTTGDCSWTLDEGLLIIEGNGHMGNYSDSERAPWGTEVERVVFGNSVLNVGPYAFFDCEQLRSVLLPDSLTEIGEHAFDGCDSLESIDLGDSVTTIGDNAFDRCYLLKSVALPDSVTYVGPYAFVYCISLKEVILSPNMSEIKEHTFEGCEKLTSLTLPESIISIGESAFEECFALVEIVNLSPLTLTEGNMDNGMVAYYAKNVCTSPDGSELITILSPDGSDTFIFMYIEGDYRLVKGFTDDGIVGLPASFRAGENTVETYSIYPRAFMDCSELVEITVPGSVTGLGAMAFMYCDALEKVVLPDSLACIGDHTFDGCEKLAQVNMPADLTQIGDEAFAWCSSLNEIDFPNKLVSIGGNAFYYCTNIMRVYLPESLMTIGDEAFSQCYGLIEVINDSNLELEPGSTVHGGVAAYAKHIGTSAGGSMIIDIISGDGTDTFTFMYFNEEYHLLKGTTSDGIVALPESFEFRNTQVDSYLIYEGAFQYNERLTEVVIPASVTEIGDYAFELCENLSRITFSAGLTSIGEYAFYKCGSLEEAVLPSTLTHIGEYSFADSGLRTINLPDSLICLGMYAFRNCSISEITVPGSITDVGEGAFRGCRLLTSVTLQDGLKTLAPEMFGGCPGSESLIIPDSVTRIYYASFGGWDSLKAVKFSSNLEFIREYVFDCKFYDETGTEIKPDVDNLKGCFFHLIDGKMTKATSHAPGEPISENRIGCTCTVDGTYDEVVYCTDCHLELSRVQKTVPAPGHDIIIDRGYAATCTKEGLSDGSHCSVCKTVLTLQTVIPATPHVVVVDAAVPSTRTSEGLTEGAHCRICGGILAEQMVIPIIGNTASVSKLTCVEDIMLIGTNDIRSLIDQGLSLEITNNGISVILPPEVLSKVIGDMGGDFCMRVVQIPVDDLDPLQRKAAEGALKVLSIDLEIGTAQVHELGGAVTVIVDVLDIPRGSDPYVEYLKDDGTTERMECSLMGGKLIFETDHFSRYAVMTENGNDINETMVMLAIMIGIFVVTFVTISVMRRMKR